MNLQYGRIYSRWHSYDPGHLEAMKAHFGRILRTRLPDSRSTPVLDLGCAMGFALLTLREMGFTTLLGIDTDPGLVEGCRLRGLPVERTEDSLAFLEGRRGEFGLILALDILEHLPPEDLPAYLSAMGRALAPGGRVIATVPNADSPLAERWRSLCWTHRNSFTRESLGELLEATGFRIISLEGFEVVDPGRSLSPRSLLRRLLLRLQRRVRRWELWSEGVDPSLPLSLDLICVAERGQG